MHANRNLLGGHTSVYVFAAGSAHKEQFYIALSRAAAPQLPPPPDGVTAAPSLSPGAGVEELYAEFCSRVHAMSPAAYYTNSMQVRLHMYGSFCLHISRLYSVHLAHVAWQLQGK